MALKKTIILLGILSLLLLTGCTSNETKTDATQTVIKQKEPLTKETLTIAGSTTVQPIVAKAAEKYMLKKPNIIVSVQGGGSGTGIKMTAEGSADIGTSSRELTEEELSKGLKPYEIAADGIAVIVNPSNTITDLTKQQIKDIFSGKIKNFKEVGGPDREIVVVIREQGSGTRTSFEEIVMDKGKTNNTEKAEQQPSNGAVKSTIMSNPNAIGYVGAGYIDSTIKAVSVEGVAPTKENIKTGKYKISRKLYAVTKGEATGKTKDFIDYLLSEEGQKIVEEEGFVRII